MSTTACRINPKMFVGFAFKILPLYGSQRGLATAWGGTRAILSSMREGFGAQGLGFFTDAKIAIGSSSRVYTLLSSKAWTIEPRFWKLPHGSETLERFCAPLAEVAALRIGAGAPGQNHRLHF